MTVKMIIYRLSDGCILRTVTCPEKQAGIQVDSSTEGSIPWVERTNENYVVNGVPVYVPPQPPPPPTLEESKAAKKAEIAAARYRDESCGILVLGTIVDTSREARAQMDQLISDMKAGYVTVAQWKTNGQWLEVTLGELEQIRSSVAQHVQVCFGREHALVCDINQCQTVEEVEGIKW